MAQELELERRRTAQYRVSGVPAGDPIPWSRSDDGHQSEPLAAIQGIGPDFTATSLQHLSTEGHEPNSSYSGRILRPTFSTSQMRLDASSMSSAWHLWSNDTSVEKPPQTMIPADMPITVYGEELIDVFFDHRWPQLPILHKSTLIKQHYDPVSKGLRASKTSFFQVYMVLAIAASEKPRLSNGLSVSHSHFFKLAIRDLDNVMGSDEFQCIQCLLLLCMYGSNEPQRINMWYTVGLALRLAVGIDLHRQESISGADKKHAELSKRLFWSIYVVDRSLSVAMGRPLSIQDADITMPEPLQLTDDQLGVYDVPPVPPNPITGIQDTSTFLHIIKLRRLSAEIYSSFHSAGNTPIDNESLDVLRQHYSGKLGEWLITAPHYILTPSTWQSPEWFQLAYHHAILSLYRPSHTAPIASIHALNLCANSSISLLSSYSSLYAKNKICHTFVALHSIFMAAVTMLYTFRASSKVRYDLTKLVVETNIASCLSLLTGIANGRAIGERCSQIIGRLGEATLSLFDRESLQDQQADTEFQSWFGLKSHALNEGWFVGARNNSDEAPVIFPMSIDLAWTEFFAQSFDLEGSQFLDFLP